MTVGYYKISEVVVSRSTDGLAIIGSLLEQVNMDFVTELINAFYPTPRIIMGSKVICLSTARTTFTIICLGLC
jgi:hypothetical protein